jgi:hypothetical protein
MNEYKESQLFEEFVYDVLHKEIGLDIKHYKNKYSQIYIGENRQGIEVKYQKDFLTIWGGRLYFEVEAKDNWKPDGKWIDSVLFRYLSIPGDNTIWVAAGNYELFYLFDLVVLQDMHNSNKYPVREATNKTSRGFSVPSNDLEEKCVIKFIKGKAVFMNRPRNPDVKIIDREIQEEDRK